MKTMNLLCLNNYAGWRFGVVDIMHLFSCCPFVSIRNSMDMEKRHVRCCVRLLPISWSIIDVLATRYLRQQSD